MAPKAELVELKAALADIQAKLTPLLAIEAKLSPLLALEAKLTPLLKLVQEFRQEKVRKDQQDNRLVLIDRKQNDVDQQLRMNIILTVFQLKPRAKPGAANVSMEACGATAETVESQVGSFLTSKRIFLDLNVIEICHPLPGRKESDKPAILIRFLNQKHKIALMKQRKLLKGSEVYINHLLSKNNALLAKHARLLKRKKQIQSTWVQNSRIYVKPNGPPDLAKAVVITNMKDFEKCVVTDV